MLEVISLHDQREQAVISSNDQEKRKIGRTDTLLHRRCKNDIPDEGDRTRGHDVPASIVSAVAVPSLNEDHEPSHDVGRHSEALSVDRRETKAFDELNKPQASVINK